MLNKYGVSAKERSEDIKEFLRIGESGNVLLFECDGCA